MSDDKSLASLLTKKQKWAVAGIMLGLSAWMFFLGILVGRGTAPVKFNIDRLEEMLRTKRIEAEKRAEAVSSSEVEDSADVLGDLRTSQSSEPLQPVAPRPNETTAPSSHSGPASANQPPLPQPEESSDATVYTVQVASLRGRDSAKQMIADLAAKGYNAYLATSSSNNGTWYRVRIGRFKNKADADRMVQRVKRESFDSLVVKIQ